ncbi:MAG: Rrf2 family transcriptional regulator [Elusimicrobiota bacterium]
MRITTKGHYGIRAMMELAVRYNNGPVQQKDISRHQEIPYKYLERIMNLLTLSGLVRSMRGHGGGFVLSKPPEGITLFQILEATEGSLVPMECLVNSSVCARYNKCVVHDVWSEWAKASERILNRVTLKKLVDKQYGKKK